LTGSALQAGATVTFSGTGITVNSVTGGGPTLAVNVTLDPGATLGARNVTVTNPDGGAVSKSNAFAVNAPPAITSISPTFRAQGVTGSVVINGSGYLSNITTGAAVSFGAGVTVNSFVRNSASKLTANITVDPAAAPGPRDVTVTNPDGGVATCGGCFTVNPRPTITPPPTPVPQGVGVANRVVSVTGTGFQAGATVSLGAGVTVAATVNSDTSLTLTVSVANNAATGFRNLVVTNPDGGSASCSTCFVVNAKPTVSSLAPGQLARGSTNISVALTGTRFQQGATVAFSGAGVTATVTSVNSATSMTLSVTVGLSAPVGKRNVQVTNPDGGVGSGGNVFRVT
jgi:hypothetical protein